MVTWREMIHRVLQLIRLYNVVSVKSRARYKGAASSVSQLIWEMKVHCIEANPEARDITSVHYSS